MEAVASSIEYFFYLLIYLLFCQAKNIWSTSALNIFNLSKMMYRMRSVRIKLARFFFSVSHNKLSFIFGTIYFLF